MFKKTTILAVGALGLITMPALYAQTEDAKPIEEPYDLTEKGYRDAQTGLKVEERRYENRLDGVTVEREGGKVQDYYDLADPDLRRREGSIVEQGAMRTWRFGGSK